MEMLEMRPCRRRMDVIPREELEYGKDVWARDAREEVRSWVIRLAGGVLRCIVCVVSL